jgi:hypothetical protein
MKNDILTSILKNISNEVYCVSKIKDIDELLKSKEINLLCASLKLFSKKVLSVLNNYNKYGFEVVVSNVSKLYWVIKISKENNTILILHLYSSFKKYKNFDVSESLFTSILDNRIENKFYVNKILIKIYFPKNIDYLIIKYLNYLDLNYKMLKNNIDLNSNLKIINYEIDRKIFLDRINRHVFFIKKNPQNKIYKLFLDCLNLKKRL